jgi:hypothetical protein
MAHPPLRPAAVTTAAAVAASPPPCRRRAAAAPPPRRRRAAAPHAPQELQTQVRTLYFIEGWLSMIIWGVLPGFIY